MKFSVHSARGLLITKNPTFQRLGVKIRVKPNAFGILILLMMSSSLQAQQSERPNSLTLQWGGGTIIRQDLVFSPFAHSDFSAMNIGLTYHREGSFSHQLALRYSGYAPMLAGPYEFQEFEETKSALPHQFTYVDLDYIVAKPILTTERGQISVGGGLANEFQLLNYVYGRIASFGYYINLGLHLYGSYTHQFNERHHLTTDLQLPLVAWAARSPFAVNDDEFIENTTSHRGLNTLVDFIGDGQLTSWNQVQSFEISLAYSYVFSNRWSVGINDRFGFVRYDEPRKLLSFQNVLSISTTFNF